MDKEKYDTIYKAVNDAFNRACVAADRSTGSFSAFSPPDTVSATSAAVGICALALIELHKLRPSTP